MRVAYCCPACQQPQSQEVARDGARLECAQCHWSRTAAEGELEDGRPVRCLACGCGDLWRQKNFPPQLGLTMVGLGALLSTIAWSYYLPVVALGILMVFALMDLVLYAVMSDVLVCYRCDARHAQANLQSDETPRFSLETHERYRQEALRLQQAETGRA